MRHRSASRGSRAAASAPVTAASVSSRKLLPTTAASCSSARSSGPSASRREAMSACRVSGTLQAPQVDVADDLVRVLPRSEDPAVGEHPDRLDGVQRHALGALDDPFDGAVGCARRSSRGPARPSPRPRAAPGGAPRSSAGRRPSSGDGRSARAATASRWRWACVRDHSSSDSTKSRSPSSAHCRSSKTITTVPRVADPLEERCATRRTAPRRPPAGRSSRPSRNARRGSSQRRSSSSGTRLGDRGGELGPGDARRVGLGDAGSHAHHLAERPERDAVAVGGAAPVVPVDVLGEAVDVLQ